MAAYVAGRSGWIHSPRRAGREHPFQGVAPRQDARDRLRAQRADGSAASGAFGSQLHRSDGARRMLAHRAREAARKSTRRCA